MCGAGGGAHRCDVPRRLRSTIHEDRAVCTCGGAARGSARNRKSDAKERGPDVPGCARTIGLADFSKAAFGSGCVEGAHNREKAHHEHGRHTSRIAVRIRRSWVMGRTKTRSSTTSRGAHDVRFVSTSTGMDSRRSDARSRSGGDLFVVSSRTFTRRERSTNAEERRVLVLRRGENRRRRGKPSRNMSSRLLSTNDEKSRPCCRLSLHGENVRRIWDWVGDATRWTRRDRSLDDGSRIGTETLVRG